MWNGDTKKKDKNKMKMKRDREIERMNESESEGGGMGWLFDDRKLYYSAFVEQVDVNQSGI